MHFFTLVAPSLVGALLVRADATTAEPPEKTIQPSLSAIVAAAQTAPALSPVSNVKGAAFDRFFQVWLENTDYDSAAGDANQQYFASKGISLTNYWAVTHPSEPNYAAAVAGDYFGMDDDAFHSLPSNISTVVDLLDTKGISWGEYQENAPYAGFQGFNYSNQVTFNNSYVRKHNPLILFSSVTNNATRLSLIKNFTSFDQDVAAKTLPQWSFMTPNMTNDGHDTNVSFASQWERTKIGPLLDNSYFMENTLILLTFDEIETYPKKNKVFAVLLGGAIPQSLWGTTDDTFYTHYSSISSASVNWGLPSLGRWDCDANVFAVVANKTGYKNQAVATDALYLNASYPGPLSSTAYSPAWAVPDTTAKCASGLGVLDSVVKAWGGAPATYNYTNAYPNAGGSAASPSGTAPGSSPTAKAGAARLASASLVAALCAVFVAALVL